MSAANRQCVSLVVPVFNEAELIGRLHREIVLAMERIDGADWEVVYVDDGSTDGTIALLRKQQALDERIIVVELSRNWGHQAALTAGLSVARGDAIVLMDGDLQDPPSVIPRLVEAWRNGGQVVVAQRKSRAERGVRRWLFSLFYRILGFLSDYPIPLNAGIFGLLDRQAADAINRLTESNRYLPGLRAWVGFRTRIVHYDRAERAGGETKQSLLRLFKYAFDAIFSFSYKPLRLSLAAGASLFAFAIAYGGVLVALRLMGKGMFGIQVVDGYTSTIVAVLLLGGVQLVSVGILGEYIGRIYDEVKRRPLFMIQNVHRSGDVAIPARVSEWTEQPATEFTPRHQSVIT